MKDLPIEHCGVDLSDPWRGQRRDKVQPMGLQGRGLGRISLETGLWFEAPWEKRRSSFELGSSVLMLGVNVLRSKAERNVGRE